MQIILANPRGFCAGVDRAIEIVDQALDAFGAPIYVRHEVVHNRTVVDGLKEKGAIFIEDLTDVPIGSYLIFSAHGVSKKVQQEAPHDNAGFLYAKILRSAQDDILSSLSVANPGWICKNTPFCCSRSAAADFTRL